MVGGIIFISELVDIEDRLIIEIYTSSLGAWKLCSPLPVYSRFGNSSWWLCLALYKGKFHAFEIYSCFIFAFYLINYFWTSVQTWRFLGMSCSLHFTCWNQLVLVWLYNLPYGSLANLWRFDEEMKEFSAIAIML